jgi:hypothetical protein
MAYLSLSLNTIMYFRYVLNKDINMSAKWKEVLMTSPRRGTRFHSKMKVATILCLDIHIRWQTVGSATSTDAKIKHVNSIQISHGTGCPLLMHILYSHKY